MEGLDRRSRLSIAAFVLGWMTASAAEAGKVEGRVSRAVDGVRLPNVEVTLAATGESVTTDRGGRFEFDDLSAGAYELVFVSGANRRSEPGIRVESSGTTELDIRVDWELAMTEAVAVFAASRRQERIVDAPAAVTVISETQILEGVASGQLPKLLEFTPGAEVTQSGLYDYNFNTRGFNSSLNRRVATLIDGRDPSVPFLGAQEWAGFSLPLDDLMAAEFVRGPSAALYGANASSGVLNLQTKAPRDDPGGTVRVVAGELDTYNADFRWAGELGKDWWMKAVAGTRRSGDFAVSRNTTGEYAPLCPGGPPCLPREAVPLERVNDDDIDAFGLRFDRYFPEGEVLTVEGGTAEIAGPVFQTGIGRVQVLDVSRPWTRANWTAAHWNVLAYWNRRDAPRQLALASGTNLVLDSENWQLEAQTHWDFLDDKVRVVGGASYGEEDHDSFDPRVGRQSALFAPVDADFTALYGQVDWKLLPSVKLVGAARWDDSTLHDAQFSPKASLVWSLTPQQTLRLTYNEAFQVGNYSELFLQTDIAPPVNLSGFEAICAAESVSCGFGTVLDPRTWTRVLALGNENLELEEVQTWELGYGATIGKRAYVSLDYYTSDNQDFITDLIPQLDGTGNRTNPDFGAYVPPDELSPAAQATLLGAIAAATAGNPQLAALSNNLDGTPILAGASYTNFGRVDTQGVDLGLQLQLGARWVGSFSYSWFDFDIQETPAALAAQLEPNTPEHKVTAGVSWRGEKADFSASWRWVDEFRWVVGPFQGPVDTYRTTDVTANHHIGKHWTIGLNVANLFDAEHWESFGGDLLGRRALAHATYGW